jgi:hypothetical protein
MTDNNSDRLFFNTDALPERDRFPAFCEELFRRIIGSDIVEHGLVPFRGALQLRRAGVVSIANIDTTPVDIIRNASHTNDGDDAIVVQLWQQGAARVTQRWRESPVKAREGIVLDNTNTGRVYQTEASRFWVLTIPRDTIASLTPNVARFAAARLSDDLSARLLFGYLEGTLALGLDNHQAAVTAGTDAQAEVSVRLPENGRSVTAKGADPDNLVASAKAYLAALNKLMARQLRGHPDERRLHSTDVG